jgi:hypothetical protein
LKTEQGSAYPWGEIAPLVKPVKPGTLTNYPVSEFALTAVHAASQKIFATVFKSLRRIPRTFP